MPGTAPPTRPTPGPPRASPSSRPPSAADDFPLSFPSATTHAAPLRPLAALPRRRRGRERRLLPSLLSSAPPVKDDPTYSSSASAAPPLAWLLPGTALLHSGPERSRRPHRPNLGPGTAPAAGTLAPAGGPAHGWVDPEWVTPPAPSHPRAQTDSPLSLGPVASTPPGRVGTPVPIPFGPGPPLTVPPRPPTPSVLGLDDALWASRSDTYGVRSPSPALVSFPSPGHQTSQLCSPG